MGEFSIWHWLIVLAVVLLLFGGGRVSGLMGDLAKGIKAFKKNIADEDAAPAPRIEPPAGPVVHAAPAEPARDKVAL
ncbi:MAG TPA: twin-arginine translocase TatA/TatE family subunit [Acetobacteraceae bacterium]|nr:twin-arginine translocase TatA/TatE family subunit [Acetobacteraceae bacterium]